VRASPKSTKTADSTLSTQDKKGYGGYTSKGLPTPPNKDPKSSKESPKKTPKKTLLSKNLFSDNEDSEDEEEDTGSNSSNSTNDDAESTASIKPS
ncbi:hypothetical protein HDU76_011298, partial [Blyttiomyces sp. JEL0837]